MAWSIIIWLEAEVVPGPPRILSNPEIFRRLADFDGCVSVSAETTFGLKAILGQFVSGPRNLVSPLDRVLPG